jgi:integrase/recombinase XerD
MAGQARILSSKEIGGIFKVLPTARDKALFAIGIYTGLRVGEIVSLRTDQLFSDAGNVRHVLKVKRTKKKNTVFNDIPVHPKLKNALSNYRNDVELGAWLFPSEASSTGHLTRAQAHNILTAAFETMGLEDASTHSMRRTCLTNMSRAGVPLRTIQEISGHASLSDLQAYLAVDPDDKRRAINLLRY